jgi:hypothetical protein
MLRPLSVSKRTCVAASRSRSLRLGCIARASRTDKLRQLLKGPEIIKVCVTRLRCCFARCQNAAGARRAQRLWRFAAFRSALDRGGACICSSRTANPDGDNHAVYTALAGSLLPRCPERQADRGCRWGGWRVVQLGWQLTSALSECPRS